MGRAAERVWKHRPPERLQLIAALADRQFAAIGLVAGGLYSGRQDQRVGFFLEPDPNTALFLERVTSAQGECPDSLLPVEQVQGTAFKNIEQLRSALRIDDFPLGTLKIE